MKILRIVSAGFEEGGVENGIVLLQPILEAKGHDVRSLSSDTRPEKKHFNVYSFKAVDAMKPSKYLYFLFNPYSYSALKKVLGEFKPDAVHLHTMVQPSASVLFLLKKYPTVMTIHGPESFTKSLLPWYMPISDYKNGEFVLKELKLIGKARYMYLRHMMGTIYKIGLRNVDKIITLSGYMHSEMTKDGLKNVYVPYGTVLLQYQPLAIDEIDQAIVYAGRLEKFKGVDYLVRAFKAVADEFPKSKLLIAGNGSERGNLEKLAGELKISDRVEFLGQLKRPELEKLYQRASVVVMPSTWPEAFGKIGIEAMSVGRPVIATDVGGVTDWLADEETGYLVPKMDSGAIANALRKLFSNPELIIEMGAKGRKRAEDFSLEKHADRMIELYQSVIDEYKRA